MYNWAESDCRFERVFFREISLNRPRLSKYSQIQIQYPSKIRSNVAKYVKLIWTYFSITIFLWGFYGEIITLSLTPTTCTLLSMILSQPSTMSGSHLRRMFLLLKSRRKSTVVKLAAIFCKYFLFVYFCLFEREQFFRWMIFNLMFNGGAAQLINW